MEDETSNDSEAVEYVDSQSDDGNTESRPIMLLLQRLINHKQNTVMTNAQITDILKKELDINIDTMHVLEVDIYIKIIKKFLKDWPQWEDLEHIATKLHKVKDHDAISKVLNKKYKNLKEYLGVMLDAAKPLARTAVEKIENNTPSTSNEDESIENIESDVVMEIQCTRDQLRHLFFRKPRPDLNLTVFNMSKVEPSRIIVNTIPFETILKCWALKININLPYFTYTRELFHELKHVLVNKARNDKTAQDINLKTCLEMKPGSKTKNEDKINLTTVINDIMSQLKCRNEDQNLLPIIQMLKNDLEILPREIKVPSKYRHYANKYKYVRYLFAENNESSDTKYDLQLEEMMSPLYVYSIGKILNRFYNTFQSPLDDWLQVECVLCKVKFTPSQNIKDSVEQHYNDVHVNEPDWQCASCKEVFKLEFLAENRWRHVC